MSIAETFNETISYYDSWMRDAIPEFNLMYGYPAQILKRENRTAPRVLDLGAGTGLLTEFVLAALPDAEAVLLDAADKLLEAAAGRFSDRKSTVSFLTADYRNLSFSGEYDFVVSSLSIHHLEHEEKQELFRNIFAALKPGGLFLNLDQLKAPTDALARAYWDEWLLRVREAGKPENQILESIERRTAFDRDASVEDQCRWLREAGFIDVDTPLRHTFIALFSARKAA